MTERILPDTDVLGKIWNPRGLPRVSQAIDRVADRILSVIVLGETYRGIRQLQPSRRRDSLDAFYAGIVRDHLDDVLSVTLAVADIWGEITAAAQQSSRTLPPADGLIAATAIADDLTLWTRNTADFASTGARLYNPWED